MDSLQVSSADHVKQWSAGDVIQIVDPAGKMVAIDISPVMQTRLGKTFAQDGVLLSAMGSAEAMASIVFATTEPSPVSATNLVFVRGDETRTLQLAGVYG